MLRNARNSTSSSNTTANIPITNTSHRDSFPKSVSSSHADDSIPFSLVELKVELQLQDFLRHLVQEPAEGIVILVLDRVVLHMIQHPLQQLCLGWFHRLGLHSLVYTLTMILVILLK